MHSTPLLADMRGPALNVMADIAPRQVGGCNGIHRDGRNSDSVPYTVGPVLKQVSSVLEGSAVLFGPSVRPDGMRFVTTGRPGGERNLHRLTPAGRYIESDPDLWAGIDARACTDVPLFDREGRLFISGARHVWCYGPDGKRLWQTDIAALGASGGFVSTILTREGRVGGITLDSQMVLLDRENGAPAIPVKQVSTGRGFPPPARMPGLWRGGLMDLDLLSQIEPGFFGFGFPVTCSPAVNPLTGVIYIPVASGRTGMSELIGIAETSGKVEVLFSAPINGLCTSSPAVSGDGMRVYTVNGRGELLAFDADQGGLVWCAAGGAPAASPAIGPDGVVYSGGRDPETGLSALSAFEGGTGEILWRQTFGALASEALPERPESEFFADRKPHASVNSVQTVAPNVLLMAVTLGYEFRHPRNGWRIHQPHLSYLLSINPQDGTILSKAHAQDTSEAVIVAAPDGYVHMCHAALLSSVSWHGLNPALPEILRSPLKPRGGISTFAPSISC